MYLKICGIERGMKISKLYEFGLHYNLKLIDVHLHGDFSKINCFYSGIVSCLKNAQKNAEKYFGNAKVSIHLSKWVEREVNETLVCNVFVFRDSYDQKLWSHHDWQKYSNSVGEYVRQKLNNHGIDYAVSKTTIPGMIMIQIKQTSNMEKILSYQMPLFDGDTLEMSDKTTLYIYADKNRKSHIFSNEKYFDTTSFCEEVHIVKVLQDNVASTPIPHTKPFIVESEENVKRSEIEKNFDDFMESIENVSMYLSSINGIYNGESPSKIVERYPEIFIKLHRYENFERFKQKQQSTYQNTLCFTNEKFLSESAIQLILTLLRGVENEERKIYIKNFTVLTDGKKSNQSLTDGCSSSSSSNSSEDINETQSLTNSDLSNDYEEQTDLDKDLAEMVINALSSMRKINVDDFHCIISIKNFLGEN